MYWSGVVTLLGWGVIATAQGRLGIDDQSACAPAYRSLQYVGCYGDTLNGAKAGFPFRVSTAQTGPKSYPGLISSANLTVNICSTACRAHGFDYAMMYAGIECWCATQLPYPQPPASVDTTNGNGLYTGSSPGTQSPDPSCSISCPGNSSQVCGGNSHGSVYTDLSFENDTSPATIGTSANYGYFGCYVNSGGGPGFIQIHLLNIDLPPNNHIYILIIYLACEQYPNIFQHLCWLWNYSGFRRNSNHKCRHYRDRALDCGLVDRLYRLQADRLISTGSSTTSLRRRIPRQKLTPKL